MKKIFFCLVLLNNTAFAQLDPLRIQGPTQFDRFVVQPNIEWATYVTDTIRFEKSNLSKILRDRLKKNEIKVSLPLICRTLESNNIIYIKKDQQATQLDTIPPGLIDYDLINATGILFIENGKLKSYITWVSPSFPKVTSLGISLGEGDYFSSSFNLKYNFLPASTDKVLSLGQTKKILRIDSLPSAEMLKQLYGRNLLQTLWPHIQNNELSVYSVKSGKRLHLSDLDLQIIDAPPIEVPIFDSMGNATGKKVLPQESMLGYINTIEITQNWYYNQTKNIVTSSIPQLILFAKRFKNGAFENEPSPAIKIIF